VPESISRKNASPGDTRILLDLPRWVVVKIYFACEVWGVPPGAVVAAAIEANREISGIIDSEPNLEKRQKLEELKEDISLHLLEDDLGKEVADEARAERGLAVSRNARRGI